jgi:hypothetical protein
MTSKRDLITVTKTSEKVASQANWYDISFGCVRMTYMLYNVFSLGSYT